MKRGEPMRVSLSAFFLCCWKIPLDFQMLAEASTFEMLAALVDEVVFFENTSVPSSPV